MQQARARAPYLKPGWNPQLCCAPHRPAVHRTGRRLPDTVRRKHHDLHGLIVDLEADGGLQQHPLGVHLHPLLAHLVVDPPVQQAGADLLGALGGVRAIVEPIAKRREHAFAAHHGDHRPRCRFS